MTTEQTHLNINLPGCEALFPDGSKCEMESMGVFIYHGNPHVYIRSEFPAPIRVVVWLCDAHSKGMTRWEYPEEIAFSANNRSLPPDYIAVWFSYIDIAWWGFCHLPDSKDVEKIALWWRTT